jgi:hypothetical protein
VFLRQRWRGRRDGFARRPLGIAVVDVAGDQSPQAVTSVFLLFRSFGSVRLELMFDPVEVVEMGRKVAGADPAAGGDDELCAAAVALAELVSLASAGLAHVLAELDARGTCDRELGW